MEEMYMNSTKLDIEQILNLEGHKASIFALSQKADEPILFSGDGDGYIVEWDLKNPDTGKALAQLPSNVFCIEYVEDKKLLVAGTMLKSQQY